MSTPYTDIFKRAVFRFKDYDYLRMSEDEIHEVLVAFLHSAISDFNVDLDLEVQEILATGIAFYWTSARILDQELLRNSMSTKDYTYFSPANLMRESQTLRETLRKEYRDRIVQYTYHHGDIASINA